MFADGPGSPLDQGVATWLMVGAVFLGWIGIARLRNRAFKSLPRAGAWACTGLAVTALVLAVVLPPIIRKDPTPVRPSSTATVAITSPTPGETFHADPRTGAARVPLTVHLMGGKIVPFTSTNLVANTGHIHVYLDGSLVAMTTTLRRTLDVLPGHHTLTAEFVAVDHAPWNPRIRSSVRFVVVR
jgi:hypothetical protein